MGTNHRHSMPEGFGAAFLAKYSAEKYDEIMKASEEACQNEKGNLVAASAAPVASFGVSSGAAPAFGASADAKPSFGVSPGAPAFGVSPGAPAFGVSADAKPAFGVSPGGASFGVPTGGASFGVPAGGASFGVSPGGAAFGVSADAKPSFGVSNATASFGVPAASTTEQRGTKRRAEDDEPAEAQGKRIKRSAGKIPNIDSDNAKEYKWSKTSNAFTFGSN